MQQPPGYNPQQNPQQPQGGQQYQQQPYPQQAYYPPQKKGMPGWAWGLIIGAIVLFCGFPLLGILAIPLITSNTRDARRAEGEQMLGSAKGQARIQFAMVNEKPQTFSSFMDQMDLMDLTGQYYRVDDSIRAKPNDKAEITCSPLQTDSDGTGHMEFGWASGNSRVSWDP